MSRLRRNCIAAVLFGQREGKTGIHGFQGNICLIKVDTKGLRNEYKYSVDPSLFKSLIITKQLNINTLNTRFNLHPTIRQPFLLNT